MKKTIYSFNNLLCTYNKYRRKLANLRKANKNERRQHILQNHIAKLYEKLMALKMSVKLSTVAASIAVGTLAFAPQIADAQTFAPVTINPFGLTDIGYRSAPTFADLDGDGDLDVLTGETNGNFFYFENTGTATAPVYATAVMNPFGLIDIGNYSTPTFADLDGDGDLDVLAGERFGNFFYFENTGTATAPVFAARITNPFGLTNIGLQSAPTFADLDGDGDLDVLAGERYGNFSYFQNTGTATAPVFAARITNPFSLIDIGFYSTPTFADLDGDGDLDVLTGERDGNFFYFQNTGSATAPVFAAAVTNPFGLTDIGNFSNPAFADLDGDGDLDVLAGEYVGKFVYFQNITPPCIADQSVTASQTTICNGDSTTINVGSTEVGVNYTLRNDADSSIVGSVVAGTGAAISLPTGSITATTTYNVYAEKPGAFNDTCTLEMTQTVTITVNNSPTTTIAQTNVSCNGGTNGSATVTPTGGTAPYTYLWSNGATTATATGLAANTYNVTVTDANGCATNVSNIIITEPTALTSSVSSQTNVSCNGGTNGSATVTPTGGTAPYTYLWSNGATTATATGLAANTYNVTVTDANACTTNVSNIIITEPTALASSVSSQTNVSCNGGTNGSATVTPTGGTAPYTYLWSNGATTATATGLAANTYNVTVTDANGCTTNVSNITITEPTALASSISSQTNVSCNGGTNGSATVTPTGGTAPYTYLWSNGATTATATGLAANTYNVTVTDANGCTTNVSNITITEPAIITGTDVQTACNTFTWIDNNTYTASNNTATFNIVNGATNGCDSLVTLDLTINTVDNTTSLNVDTITANQAGATYQWLDCNNGNVAIAGATAQSFTPSVTGDYAVEVTFNGCVDTSACVNVTIVGINELSKINVSIYPNPTNGKVTIYIENTTTTTNYSIYAIDGKIVASGTSKTNTIVVDLSNESKGVYFVKLNTTNSLTVHKLIKQ